MSVYFGVIPLQRTQKSLITWILVCASIQLVLYSQTVQGKLPDDNGLKTLSLKFSDRLKQVVRTASGISVVEKSYEEAAARSQITFSSVQAQQLLTDAVQTLGQILNKKIVALQASVRQAEDLASDHVWNPNYKRGDIYFVQSVQSKKKFNQSERIEYSEQFEAKILPETSAVHIPVDIFPGDVEIVNTLAWTREMERVWKENREKDESLSWQFFGSQTGVLRFFPGSAWTGATFGKFEVDMYDVRRRPWYTQGVSSPKDMLILIDKSGSSHGQALALMKHSIKSIIDTLNENDFFNVAQFSDQTDWVGCFDTLVQANPRNKQIMKNSVDKIVASGVANYAEGFRQALKNLTKYLNICKGTCALTAESSMQVLQKACISLTENIAVKPATFPYGNIRIKFSRNENRTEGEGAECNPIIMFLTDGGTLVPEEVFAEYNPDKRVRIFTFAVGPIANPITAVRKIGCISRGDFYQIPAMGAIKSTVQKYTDIVSRGLISGHKDKSLIEWSRAYPQAMNYQSILARTLSLAPKNFTSWTPVYKSEMGQELVTTVTLPVFNSSTLGNETVSGVMGIDVPNKELLSHIPLDKLGPGGYVFIINSNGFIIYHPRMKEVDRDVLEYFSVDLVEIEEESREMLELRRSMIDRESGSVTITSHVMDSSTDDHHVDARRRTYWYAPIPNSPFSMAVVVAEDMKMYVSNLQSVPYDKGVKALKSQEIHHEIHFPFSDICETELFESLNETEEGDEVMSHTMKQQNIVEFLMNASSRCDEERLKRILLDAVLTQPLEKSSAVKHQPHVPKLMERGEQHDGPGEQHDGGTEKPGEMDEGLQHDEGTEKPGEMEEQPNGGTEIPGEMEEEEKEGGDALQKNKNDKPDVVAESKMKRAAANETTESVPQVVGNRGSRVDDGILLSFVITNSGLTRLSLSENVSRSYTANITDNPTSRSFYKRAASTGLWMYQAVQDRTDENTTDASFLVTKSVTVQSHKYPVAVVGAVMESERLRSLLMEFMPQCTDLSIRCFLIDDGGFILYATESDDFNSPYKVGSFLGKAEPLLMQALISESIFINGTRVDFQGVCEDKKPAASSALRLLPNLLYELLTLRWWSTAGSWAYIGATELLNLITSPVQANVFENSEVTMSGTEVMMEEGKEEEDGEDGGDGGDGGDEGGEGEEDEDPELVAEASMKLLPSSDQSLKRVNGSILSPCTNCSRLYGAARVLDTNMLLVYTEIDCEPKPCDQMPIFKYLPEEIDDPISKEKNCTAEFRYRRRPPCFDTNPAINMTLETYCGGSVLFMWSSFIVCLIISLSSCVLINYTTLSSVIIISL